MKKYSASDGENNFLYAVLTVVPILVVVAVLFWVTAPEEPEPQPEKGENIVQLSQPEIEVVRRLDADNIDIVKQSDAVLGIYYSYQENLKEYYSDFHIIARKFMGGDVIFSKIDYTIVRLMLHDLKEEGVLKSVPEPEKLPCTIIIHNGKEVDRVYGIQWKELESKILSHLPVVDPNTGNPSIGAAGKDDIIGETPENN